MDSLREHIVTFASRHDSVALLSIDSIRTNPYQPRREFARSALMELANSILEFGVLQPINVRVLTNGVYELIAGERRLRASRLAGMTEIPAVIYEADDEDSAILAMVENLQREDLSYMEEAEGYFCLLHDHNMTQEELSRKVGKSQSTIANKVRLLKLPPKVKEIIRNNYLSERHARTLLKLRDERDQLKALKYVCENGLSVIETEELVRNMTFNPEYSESDIPYISTEIAAERRKRRIKGNGNVKFIVKDVRIFVNTIKEAVNMMKSNGIQARAAQFDRNDYVEFVIRIPKRENGIEMRKGS